MALPLRYVVGNLLARRLRTAFAVVVVALVVVATTLFTGLVSSLERSLVASGSPRNLIVLRKGSTNDGSSFIGLDAYQAIRFFPGIAGDRQDRPLVSPELVVQPFFRTREGGRENVLVRGVEAVALRVHDEVHIVEGRMFRPSSGEAIVGRGVAGRYQGTEVGSDLHFGRSTWKVVGRFDAGGSSFESEVWVDARELASDARRSWISGIRIRVADGADMQALARRIDDDPRFALEAQPEATYYEKQAKSASTLYVLAMGLAVLAGIGATFGATNTFYASVQARTREIGTLRAIGFPRRDILAAFLAEAILVALAGFALGGAVAWALGLAVSRMMGGIAFGAATFSTNVVQLRVGVFDLGLGSVLALAIGLLGGFLPAARAARLRPVEALRRG